MPFSMLPTMVENFETPNYTIIDAYTKFSNLTFRRDPCDVKTYIKARLENAEKTDIKQISEISSEEITLATYAPLENAQPTTASVEKSFSMLNKTLAKD